jgi:hypothetical protein
MGTAAIPTKAQRVSIEVELNLRIPTLTLRSVDEPDKRIDNSTVRFSKAINVPAIPKTGEMIQLSTSAGDAFEATITRVDWNEERALFVLSCNYAKRAISSNEYRALVSDTAWRVKELL